MHCNNSQNFISTFVILLLNTRCFKKILGRLWQYYAFAPNSFAKSSYFQSFFVAWNPVKRRDLKTRECRNKSL